MEKAKAMTDFIFLVSIIIEDSDCSHEIKRHLLLQSKAMKNIDSVLESRDTASPTKLRIVKVMVFPVVMCRFENRPIRRLSAEELMPLNCGSGEDT